MPDTLDLMYLLLIICDVVLLSYLIGSIIYVMLEDRKHETQSTSGIQICTEKYCQEVRRQHEKRWSYSGIQDARSKQSCQACKPTTQTSQVNRKPTYPEEGN